MFLPQILSLVALAVSANAVHWIFGGSRPIITTREDPIVSPRTVGTHVHSVVGASRFKTVYDPVDLKNSKCTTIPVQPDKSNYWAPQMYYRDQHTGALTAMQTGFNIYYLKRNGPKNQPVKAFPPGLVMLAGDPNRKGYNASSHADQAVSFVCLDYSGAHNNDPDWAERPNFFSHNCPNGMRAQVFFPSCWDGKNLDSPDHKSHMSYPIQNFNSGDCPDSHPVQLVSLFYEMFVSVDQHPYWGPGSWVLANGDTTGYGHHADFQNGWDVDLLQNALDNCPNANGNVMDCPPLAAAFDQPAADACVLETEFVNENVGLNGPIPQLPGCNPVWDGTGTKPPCDPNANAPVSFVAAQTPLPDGWSDAGCIAEPANGRALTGAQTTSPSMTRAVCANFCASKGFKLAGIEFSNECYCDNEVRNGATTTPVSWKLCTNKCAGNSNEICGGPKRLTLLTATPGAPKPSAPSVPSTTVKPTTSANVPSSSVVVPVPSSSPTVRSSSMAAPSSAPAPSVPSTTKASSSVAVPTPSGSIPLGWAPVGCVSDGTPRALTGFSVANDQMTVATCLSTCASKGFAMAGVEFGRECYCGNSFENGQGKPASNCNMPCAGDKSSTCGGNWVLNAFKASNVHVVLPSSSTVATSTAAAPAPTVSAPSNSTVDIPAGWVALGCRRDLVAGRTLNVDAYTSQKMTIEDCVAHCDARGHTLAGLEYARECYCGNSFTSQGGAPIPEEACNMRCTGDSSEFCGGPDALTAFQKAGAGKSATPRRAAHKARNFGRAHQLSNVF